MTRPTHFTIQIRARKSKGQQTRAVTESVGPFASRDEAERCVTALATQGATDMELVERDGEHLVEAEREHLVEADGAGAGAQS